MVKNDVINALTKEDLSDLIPICQLESQVRCAHGYDLLGVSLDVDEDTVIEEGGDYLSDDRDHRGSSH